MEPIETLVMHHVARRFGATTALHSFDLTIPGGAFVTLLGPSGCGKTTALNCLAGLLDLSNGEILLNGRPIQQVPAEKRGFGMVFQNYALFPHLTAANNVAYGLTVRGVPKSERASRVQQALATVHLDGYAERFPAQLSGGQQQRLAIARTIVLQPSLLLLDEPLSNLDANLRSEMRIEIKRIHTQMRLTTLYVTHDQSEAMSMSDLVVVMRAGRIEQQGAPQEIYDRPQSLYVATFMGYANRLRGTIVGQEGERWRVQTAHSASLLATAPRHDATTLHTGQAVTLCFRPDDTFTTPTPETNQMQGRVQLVEYLGKSFESVVWLPGAEPTQILAHSPQAPSFDNELTFGVRPERLLLFPDDANDGATAPAQDAPVSEPALSSGR